jgi:hypothetical protein
MLAAHRCASARVDSRGPVVDSTLIAGHRAVRKIKIFCPNGLGFTIPGNRASLAGQKRMAATAMAKLNSWLAV